VVSKQIAQCSDVWKLNLKRLSELEVRKQYEIMISNSFATLEYLNDSKDMKRA